MSDPALPRSLVSDPALLRSVVSDPALPRPVVSGPALLRSLVSDPALLAGYWLRGLTISDVEVSLWCGSTECMLF